MEDDFLKWIIDLHESVEAGAIKMFGSGIAADEGLQKELLAEPCAELPHFGHGHPELIGAIRRRYDPAHETGEPVLAEAASGALLLACFTLLESGDVALVETPGYQPLRGAAEIAGAGVVGVQRRGARWELDPEEVRAAARGNERAKLLIVTNPHNPSGALMNEGELLRLADAFTAVRPEGKVVVDEAFLDLVPEGERPPRAATIDERFISISSLTKAHGLGWLRCGWVFAESGLTERLRRARRRDHQFGSDLLQCLAVRAFERLDAFETSAHARLAENRELVTEIVLPLVREGRLTGPLPEHGCVCFPGLPECEDVASFVEALKRRGVYVTPGVHFGEPSRFRMNFGIRNEDLRVGLTRLAELMSSADGTSVTLRR